jgi:hypothetical protein
MRFTAELLRRATVTILDQAPGAISTAGVDALLVDQVTPAGETVAEILHLPFVDGRPLINTQPLKTAGNSRTIQPRARAGRSNGRRKSATLKASDSPPILWNVLSRRGNRSGARKAVASHRFRR